jgi:hypothetical protein
MLTQQCAGKMEERRSPVRRQDPRVTLVQGSCDTRLSVIGEPRVLSLAP